jgi:hypothetical protein
MNEADPAGHPEVFHQVGLLSVSRSEKLQLPSVMSSKTRKEEGTLHSRRSLYCTVRLPGSNESIIYLDRVTNHDRV